MSLLLREAENCREDPEFKGYIHDVGGHCRLPATILQKAVKQRGMHQPPVSVSKALRQFEGGP